jgi:hypothetical protein
MIRKQHNKFQVVIRSGNMEFLIGDPVSTELDARRILAGALAAFGR